ncbi:MAG TPA: alpha/beta fold hydrolase [Thermoanaerobaculia bacterium]
MASRAAEEAGRGPMIFETFDGTQLFYDVLGSGDETAVLLNGIMMTTESWALQLRALTPKYRCIVHDFRGQLRSPVASSEGWNIELHADDLAALLDHIGVDRVHVIGTSYGGEVGMIFAYTYPERAKSLVVIASTSATDEAMRASATAGMTTARLHRDRLFDGAARAFYSPEFLRDHPEVLEQGRARLASAGDAFFRGYANLCDAFSALDITANLRAIRCPTLVIAAEKDTLKPVDCSRMIEQEIEGAQLVVIPGSGHAVFMEKPDEVNRAITSFLDSVL